MALFDAVKTPEKIRVVNIGDKAITLPMHTVVAQFVEPDQLSDCEHAVRLGSVVQRT